MVVKYASLLGAGRDDNPHLLKQFRAQLDGAGVTRLRAKPVCFCVGEKESLGRVRTLPLEQGLDKPDLFVRHAVTNSRAFQSGIKVFDALVFDHVGPMFQHCFPRIGSGQVAVIIPERSRDTGVEASTDLQLQVGERLIRQVSLILRCSSKRLLGRPLWLWQERTSRAMGGEKDPDQRAL